MQPRNLPRAILVFLMFWLPGIAGPAISTAAMPLSPLEITLAVDTQLINDPAVEAHMIDITTDDGVVTLEGTVTHLLARERAEDIAMTINGVRSVINRLEIADLPRSDEEIRRDVQQALRDEPATEKYSVQVAVSNATVVLTGLVDSWQEKQLCGRVAKGVRGVRSVTNNIEIEARIRRSDAEIAEEIRRRMAWDVWLDPGLVAVTVQDAAVTLSGAVGSLAEKRRAYANAWVAGVVSVNDQPLVIDWSRRSEMRRPVVRPRAEASEIRRAVETTFRYDPRIAPERIDIRVENGVVTLFGEVESLKAKRMAGEDARNTVGVWRVRNHLKVRPGIGPHRRPMPDFDAQLARKVRTALLRDQVIEQDKITVTVNNYLAKLEGTVGSQHERQQAEDIASRIRGVVAVVNNLAVGGTWNPRSDEEIRDRIAEEFAWSPFVDADRIVITVSDGVAVLTGVVEDLRERRSATENAFEGGARQVRNHVKVRYGPEHLQP
jgi:osmotically-inducible protein OsmY